MAAIPERPAVGHLWMALSLTAAALMTVASIAGLVAPATYAKETPSWAAQAVAQDAVNLLLILPALLIALWFVARGSSRALLVLIGLLIYIVYSYVLYAFFVHFNALFLVYVATLGASSWSLAGIVATLDRAAIVNELDGNRRRTLHAAYLILSGGLFASLWLSAIVPAIWSGVLPRDIVDNGLTVNPVHVLDLAFVLPAMIAGGCLLLRRRSIGLLAAVPLMTFVAAMGAAIVAMAEVMGARGLDGDAAGVIAVMTLLTGTALFLTATFLRRRDQRDIFPAPLGVFAPADRASAESGAGNPAARAESGAIPS